MVRYALFALTFVLTGSLLAGPPGLTIDYPADGTLFPPDFSAPQLLWHDSSKADTWRIEISFGSGAAALRATSNGAGAAVLEIDEDCISTTNQPPKVDTEQRSWRPTPQMWAQIQRGSLEAPAALTFSGMRAGRVVSKAVVHIRTSRDPVGAPIFYRDVPLMPVETEPGTIQPLSPYAVRLVKWRVRSVGASRSRVVMEGLPVCANCHSFSGDGRVMGMDLDGLRKNKGQYFLAEVSPEVKVGQGNMIQWASDQGRLENAIRVGFMSQVSPKGDAVVTTIDAPGTTSSNYYVANFTDYRFLQVFFPTRGRLAWYSRATGVLKPLPGADDPEYVHFGAVWSPDGASLVFARARAQDPNPPGHAAARFANDPNELQIRYDLYRIPFREGQGGKAEAIEGASNNGMSNTFPKISPDGRWLVFVQARNGQLMRPDSQLYIVPALGGEARRMNCNTALMNSWHSFSPNGRWMVFSSKARSPYTQMYLTHIDEAGNDTPAVLIENATAANRAVNLPEFVNVREGELRSIGGPALEYYRLYDRAVYFEKEKQYGEAAGQWRALLEVAPEDEEVRRRLGLSLLLAGRRDEASVTMAGSRAGQGGQTRVERAIRLLESGRDAEPVSTAAEPNAREHYYLALAALRRGEKDVASFHLRQAVSLDPDSAEAQQRLAAMAVRPAEALAHWRETIRLRPNNAVALCGAAWILATNQELRNGPEAVALAVRALLLVGGDNERVLDTLAAAYAEANRFEDAAATVRRALAAKPVDATLLERRLENYLVRKPWRE
ncbi:hypothetical protein [Paludibaculum fermentans]|uniref:hypothetical protein n=1 Tax=Paludibaculum fermentans TaxID=1473598 RepID=UPI003EB9326A